MKLFLDDLRNPARYGLEGWTLVQNVQEAASVLASGRDVDVLSLDYDLEEGCYGCAECQAGVRCPRHETGADLVAWLGVTRCWPGKIQIHSANANGRERMAQMLKDLGWSDDVKVVRIGVGHKSGW